MVLKYGIPLLISCSLASSCVIVGPKHGRSQRAVHQERCHPSEYWDGHDCRKKGKGHDKDHRKGKNGRGHGHDHRN